ncbi:MAG: restriction endonuclease subunit S [Ruminococcus sp.]|nr:restriction endonuclease subunit S [Ruminococcus sp.]
MPYAYCEQIGKEIRDISDEIPFEIPDSWEWCKVGDLCSNLSGLSYKKDLLSQQSPQMVRVLRGGNIADGKYLLKDDDVIISSQFVKPELYLKKNYMITPSVTSMEHIGKIALIDKDFEDTVVGGFVLMLIPHFNNDVLVKYLLYAFSTKYHRDCCRSITHKSGQAFYNLSREKLMEIYVPIPPLSEQLRIVAKIEELLPYIERYGKAEEQLTALNTTFPEALKKSILQEAVQGKLVPQNPDDEPASVLLERIRAEKQALIKAGKIKRDKHESVIVTRDKIPYEIIDGKERCIADEVPFELPESWCWCRWGELSQSIQYGYNAPAKETGRIKMVRISDIQDNKVLWDTVPFCDIDEESIETYLLKSNDILFARTGGTVGKSYLVKAVPEEAIYAGYLIRTRYSNSLSPEYLKFFMESELYWNQLRNGTIATAQPNCNGKTLANMFVPVPPLAEQKRIVEKIEELMQYCDKL